MNELLTCINALPPGVRYALYGAGQYTRRMIAGASRDEFFQQGRNLVGVIDDAPGPSPEPWLPRATLDEALTRWRPDWIVLSTDCHQYGMLWHLRDAGQKGTLPEKIQIAMVPELSDGTWREELNQRPYVDQARELLELGRKYCGGLAGKRLLDFGCGKYYPVTLWLHSQGLDVVGVDVDRMETNPRFMEGLHRHLVAQLVQQSEHPLRLADVKLAMYDGRTLPFPDETFDLVFSITVMEHVADVERALDEIRRVLKPGGWSWQIIHYYAGITGFHPFCKPYYYRRPLVLPPEERPWAHLYDEDAERMADLNRWREDDFHRAIAERFEIVVSQPVFPVGEAYLTPELEQRLANLGYSRRELLTEVGKFWLRRK